MTPGVVANVREDISSSLRNWIIESLEHFGVDSRVFLHVIQSILEQDVRSLRGEDALDDPWRGRLASVGSKRGGRDPKRQMNEDDLRRCVLLENMRACFKEDESDVAEEFVDELLHRWTEEARMSVEANGGVKNSGQVLNEEMDDEENKGTKDPVREYNEAFPALGSSLGSSPRASPANQTEPASESTGRQNRNCVELLKDLFHLSAASSLNNPEGLSDCVDGSAERANRCCREFAKSMAIDFVNSSVMAANTRRTADDDSVQLLSNELLQRCNIVADLSMRFTIIDLRATDVSCESGRSVGAQSAPPDDSCVRRWSSVGPSLQTGNLGQELSDHLGETLNISCPTLREASKFFQPLASDVLSRTVERILSQSVEGVACCHDVPEGGVSSEGVGPHAHPSLGCVQCSSRRLRMLDFPIYTENEVGMLIRLGEYSSLMGADQRRGYGVKGHVDASHLVIGVGVGEDVTTGNLSIGGGVGGGKEVIAKEGHLSVSSGLSGPLHLSGQGSSEGHRGELRHPCSAVSGWKGGESEVMTSRCSHEREGHGERHRDESVVGCCSESDSHHSSSVPFASSSSQVFCRFSHDAVSAGTRHALPNSHGLCSTGRGANPGGGMLHGQSGTVDAAVGTASRLNPSELNDFLCSGKLNDKSSEGCYVTGTEVVTDSSDALTRPIVRSGNGEGGSCSARGVSSLPGNDDDCTSRVVTRDRDASSCDVVVRLLADVIERDLMKHIASSLIPLFPDLSAPHDLFLPEADILPHLSDHRPLQPNRADVLLGRGVFGADTTCESDYALYLHLAVREECLHVDHVLNFRDFCVWRKCLVGRMMADACGSDISCICHLCHRALTRRRLSHSRNASADAVGSEAGRNPPVAHSEHRALEREQLLSEKKCERKELQLEEQGAEKHNDSDSYSSSNPAFVLNACLQNSSVAGTGDFTGNLGGITTGKVIPPGGKDGSRGFGSVGEGGDVLPQRQSSPIDRVVGVFGRNSMRAIWPDGDTDRKSDDCAALKEDFEENNNILQSFGFLPESSGLSWPLSEGVALGNSLNIWLNTGTSLAGAASCKTAASLSAKKSFDETVLRDIAGDKRFAATSECNTTGYAFDLGVSAANVCDMVATVCSESAGTSCDKPSFPSSVSDQSALIRNSFDGSSLSTSSGCRNWFGTDATEVASASITSESKLLVECLSPSIQTLERLLSSDEESSSSALSFRSALHDDFYSLWLNASPTRDHESGPLCGKETSSDCGSRSLGSVDDDDDVLRNSDVHYEADISSSDSSVDDVEQKKSEESRRGEHLPTTSEGGADLFLGLSFPLLPSSARPSSFSPVAIDDIVNTQHSSDESSSQSSLVDSSESDVSKPYSADCNSSGERCLASAKECNALLSEWELRQQHSETHDELTDRCPMDSEDLEDPTLYRNWGECGSENFGGMMPAWDGDLPAESGNLPGLVFNCGQQEEVVDLEIYENLKSIWDESHLDGFKDLTSDCEAEESLEPVDFIEVGFPAETYNQMNVEDVKRQQLPDCSALECSESYRKLAALWKDNDQPKVTAFWENNDRDSWRELATSWNEQAPHFERESGLTPDWSMNEEQERHTDGVRRSEVLSWNILHQPIAESRTDMTSCWGQQRNGQQSVKGVMVGCGLENLMELTDVHETVDTTDNFEEIESIWVGKNCLKRLKGGIMPFNTIEGENSAAFVLDNNEQESDCGNIKSLASLKSLWENEGLCPANSNGSRVDWDLSHTTADCRVGVASGCFGHQMVEIGNRKDLTNLKSIWEEKQPCSVGSVVVEQNWETNEMGGGCLGNAGQELQLTQWVGNKTEAEEDLLERASIYDQQEVADDDSLDVDSLRFIWEDEDAPHPAEAEHSKGMSSSSSSSNPPSTALQKLKPGSDSNQLNAERLLEPRNATVDVHQATNMEASKDLRFIWDVDSSSRCNDGNADGLTSNWDQQELTADMKNARPDSASLHSTTDLDNCLLLTSIWERRYKDNGKTSSSWEVRGSMAEGKAAVVTVPTRDASHTIVAECARKDVGDCRNAAESLRKGKQKNFDGLKGTIWDMDPMCDGETATEHGVGLTHVCHPQENDTETFQNLTQLESVWAESKSNRANVSDARLDWALDPSEAKNFIKELTSGQEQEDAGPNNFQNLKCIWDERLPDSEDVKGLLLDWDVHPTDAVRPTSDHDQLETDPGNFQSLAQLKSIWEDEKNADDAGNGVNWDVNQMTSTQHAPLVLPTCPNQQENTDPGNFLNLSEVKCLWKGKKCSSDSLQKLPSCWENQAPELMWDANQQTSENLTLLKLGQQYNASRGLESIWKGQQQPGRVGQLEGPMSACWKQSRVEVEVSKEGTSNWNLTQLNSESFDNSLFDLNCRKFESENSESVMSSLGDMKPSNSEIFLNRRPSEVKSFRRPTSDRELNERQLRGGNGTTANVDLWQSDSDELKQMISRWDKQQTTESRRIRGLFSSHFDSQLQSNLAAEWQLAEAVDRLTASDDASTVVGRWRLAGRTNEDNVLPKLVPSENSAFQDEIPHRFVYRYAFFDPRDVVGGRQGDLETRDARTETIRHIYEPSNSIVRQLEDLFDDGQRLQAEEEALLASLPNCLFRPIGQIAHSSDRDSRQSVAASAGLATDDPCLQTRAPSMDPSEEVIEPNSPYQLYLGVESQAFVPRFRVHKELEKSAQTGEATPPMMQNNECVFGMNVILSTIALLD